MASLSFLMNAIRPNITYSSLPSGQGMIFKDIEFLKEDSKLRADCLFVGNAVDILKFFERVSNIPRNLTIVSAGDEETLRYQSNYAGNLIITDLYIVDLYTLLQKYVRQYWKCDKDLLRACYEGQTQESLLQATAGFLQMPVLLFSEDKRVLSSASMFQYDIPFLDAINRSSRLPDRLANSLLAKPSFAVQGGKCYHKRYTVNGIAVSVFAFLAEVTSSSPYYLIAFYPGDLPKRDPFTALKLCSSYLSTNLLQVRKTPSLHNQEDAFAQFLRETLSGKLMDEDSIAERYISLGLRKNDSNNFRCVVIESTGKISASRQQKITAELAELFSGGYLSIYQGRIVVLFPNEIRAPKLLDFDYESLDVVLKRYDCRAVLSHCAPLSSFRILYMLCLRALRLDRVLARVKDHAYFFFEEYAIDVIIDFCAEKYMETCKERDLMYLMSPSIYILMEYDGKHNSDLRHTLYHYLLNNKNLGKTAAATYVHKNTVANKVKKIEELIEEDIDDPMVQYRLTTSCIFAEYYEKYLGRTIDLK